MRVPQLSLSYFVLMVAEIGIGLSVSFSLTRDVVFFIA